MGSVAGAEGRGIVAAAVVDAGVVATRACGCGCSCATTKRIYNGSPGWMLSHYQRHV